MIYVILGQTAAGKTALAIKLARRFNLPLIGADAFQQYDKLTIGTAKPTEKELEEIDFHLIGQLSLAEPTSVMRYQRECRALLDKYLSAGQDIILSGGTFLYVKAALYSYEFPPEDDSDDGLENLKPDELFERLRGLDPATAESIDRSNTRRVIRAVRLAQAGRRKSEILAQGQHLLYPALFFALKVDKEEGDKAIEKRTETMFAQGLIKETQNLISEFGTDIPAFKAIGYREIVKGLREHLSESEMKELVKTDTRRYAKRQRTFLRHQFPLLMTMDAQDIEAAISYDIERNSRTGLVLRPDARRIIQTARFAVIGLGGVGSSVALSLIGLGVRHLALIDMDEVEPSNLNRQLLYEKADCGRPKALAARDRLLRIDPMADISAVNERYSDAFLTDDISFVFDCVDDVKAKADILLECRRRGIADYIATGSGLRTDASLFRCGYLSMTGEPLARALKKELKARGFADFASVKVTYSLEIPRKKKAAVIGSAAPAPAAQGLCLVSYFLNGCDDNV